MRIVRPLDVNDGNLSVTNVASSGEPDWVAGTYAAGAKVIYDGRIYEALSSTSDNPEVGASKAIPTWVRLGVPNKWRMFREGTDSRTVNLGSVDVNIAAASAVSTVACLGLKGASVRVVIEAPEGWVSPDSGQLPTYQGVSFIIEDLGTISGDQWVGGALGVDGKVYCAPYNNQQIAVIDPSIDDISLTSMGAAISGSSKWAGAVAATNGKIYCVPYSATSVLVIDPELQSASLSAFGLDLSGGAKWRGGVEGDDGKIYCAPYFSVGVLIIDPLAGSASINSFGLDLSASFKYKSLVKAGNGKIYCIPYSATTVLVIDTATGTATQSNMGADLSGGSKWVGGTLGKDGKIYCAPEYAEDILVIDPATDTAVRTTMGAAFLSTDCRWDGATLGPDEKIYCLPATGLSGNLLLVIDPASGTAETVVYSNEEVTQHESCRGSVLAGSNIYGIPAEFISMKVSFA